MRIATLVLLTNIVAASGFMPGAVAASPIPKSEECVRELVEFMQWTPGFRGLIWDQKEPFTAEWRDAKTKDASTAIEFAIAACSLTLSPEDEADLNRRYHFRPIATQLREGLQRWHANPSDELLEYSLTVTLMETRSGFQQQLAPVVIEAFGEFIREHAPASHDRVQEVLTHRFSNIAYSPSPGFSRARVLADRDLEIKAWPHPSELIFVLFHELSHASQERADRFENWRNEQTPRNWIELALFEEFRARALTAIFEGTWKSRYPQYGFSRNADLRTIWNQLRNELRSTEETPAFHEFFQEWDKKSPKEQDRFLDQLIS